MSVKATTWVYDHSPYKGIVFSVHLAIADIVNDTFDNRFWVGEENLAAKVRCSTRTVERAKGRLVKDGYLEVVDGRHGPGKTNEYRFMMPLPRDTTGDNMSGEHPTNMTEHPTIETEHPTNVTSSLYINSREPKLTQDLTQLNAEPRKSNKSQTLAGLIGEESSENSRNADASLKTANGGDAKTRKRNPFFDAMAEACGHDLMQLTKSSAAMIAKATSDIRPVCKSPDEVWAKAAIYKKLHPDWVLTPSALAKYWSELQDERAKNQVSPKYQMHKDFEDEILARLARENSSVSVAALRSSVLFETSEEVGFSPPIHKPAPERPLAPPPSKRMFEESGDYDSDDGDGFDLDGWKDDRVFGGGNDA